MYLSCELGRLSDPFLDNLLKKREEIQDELESLDRYIAAYERRHGSKAGQKLLALTTAEHGKKPRGRPAEIADAVAEILASSSRSMTRGDLAKALLKKGYQLPSTDPAKYIGTILWRQQERFVNREGEGYSLRRRRRS